MLLGKVSRAVSRPEIHLVAGTRPNFMKVAPLYHALREQDWCRPVLVHTGQHYDEDMSGAFQRDLGLPRPDHALEVGSGSHAEQTGGVMMAYEKLCLAEPPAWVVVVGDVMLDRFLYGTVERISPEGPIPVLRIEREAAMLGGAGNVLRNLAALGAAVEFFAVTGDDGAGREVRALAQAVAGGECHLLTEAGRPTTIKERYIAAGQQLLRADRDPDGAIGADTAAALRAAAAAALEGAGALVLSDYGKGVLEPETLGLEGRCSCLVLR